ncbi:hypothetical protein THF1C08_50158 [Vibrio jasicida]|uniref:Bacteriocin n=1 Tax=Vibrio jasicida TaxID=766224 RepID=A0AAU9QTL0_9VIBR|nr:hypothetical protein THF1C08_50158 [Vibrio jasicida]CAH1601727.1 hypothetical protein THF1A12_50187 [Vibrio jasicida]
MEIKKVEGGNFSGGAEHDEIGLTEEEAESREVFETAHHFEIFSTNELVELSASS